jgi:ABC-type multidrug transport system ATPase subunit
MGSSGCGKTTLMSSIVGVRGLDSGDIKIFGEAFRKDQKLKIGFMPQEIALINGFKVKEMIWFFGTIFGLNAEKIEERFQFLSSLLELPDEDRLIRDCSGGQQRRVSFAITLVHEPELLILDEPTVGVDPLLRNKIWNYLVELTHTKNVTILLTTHYIEEARQSNQVGLMRNGVQITEDSPQNIMRMCETTSMEEAFLKLSQKQEMIIENSAVNLELNTFYNNPSTSRTQSEQKTSTRPKQTFNKIMIALLMKHFMEIVRNFG